MRCSRRIHLRSGRIAARLATSIRSPRRGHKLLDYRAACKWLPRYLRLGIGSFFVSCLTGYGVDQRTAIHLLDLASEIGRELRVPLETSCPFAPDPMGTNLAIGAGRTNRGVYVVNPSGPTAFN